MNACFGRTTESERCATPTPARAGLRSLSPRSRRDGQPKVARNSRPSGNLAKLRDKCKHLVVIHAAPENCWPALVEHTVKQEWSVERGALRREIPTGRNGRGTPATLDLPEAPRPNCTQLKSTPGKCEKTGQPCNHSRPSCDAGQTDPVRFGAAPGGVALQVGGCGTR